MKIEVGSRIRDIEDGDCYYEGVVVSINPIKYRIKSILWNDEYDDSMNNQVIKLRWWLLEIFKNGKWIKINKNKQHER